MAIVRQVQHRQQADFDFDRLPNYLFIRILGQLEFRQRFNIARVNRRFMEMSDLSVSLIDSFDFGCNFYDGDTFREVIGTFARSLRVAHLGSTTTNRFDAILDLQFPRLVDVDINDWVDRVPNFLMRCPNLRRLQFRGDIKTVDVGQRVFPRVESVDFAYCSSNVIERVLDACPNIKHFSMKYAMDETYQLFRKLNQYFADRTNSMESITMNLLPESWEPPLLRHGLVNLWRLRSLRVLRIELEDITSIDICTISTSFPNLKTLQLTTRQLDGSIEALSKLRNLVDLHLESWNLHDSVIYDFVMTSEAQGLRRFQLHGGTISLRMVSDIVERFPSLKYLRVWNRGSTWWAISNFAKSLRQFARRNMKIVVYTENEWLLDSGQVRRAIEEIRRAASDDERRPGLQLAWREKFARNVVESGFRRSIEIVWMWIVLIFYRIFL